MEKEKEGFFASYKEPIKEAMEDLKTKGRRHKQIPNILTLLRLTAPLAIIPAAVIGNVPFIIGSTIAFGLTDLADGFIARNWNLTSKLGADLDALADKLFAGTLLLAASVSNPALLANVGLEMAIAGININQKAKGNEPSSSLAGKIKTWALFGLAGTSILSSVFSPAIISTLALTTTALQALTIKSYLKKYNKKSNQEAKEKEEVKPTTSLVIEEETLKGKEKIIESKQSDNLPFVIENPEVKRLKDMKTFLEHEKEISTLKEVTEEPKVYKKK